MTKRDLKFGNVVELRNGRLCLIEPTFNHYEGYVKSYLNNGESEDRIHIRNIKNAELECRLNDYREDLTNSLDSYTIIKVYKDYTLTKLLWEREKPLLTPEEKEWLSSFIKPFRDKVVNISIQSDYGDDYENYIHIEMLEDDFINLPYTKNLPFKFDGLKIDEYFSLEDLGL